MHPDSLPAAAIAFEEERYQPRGNQSKPVQESQEARSWVQRRKKNDAPPLEGPPSGAVEESPDRAVLAPEPPGGETRATRFRVVGIGASAGGLKALTSFFQAMRTDSGMALVVVTHLDPEHKSALGEILSRVTSMPVSEVEDGVAVAPNHVYVMPANRDMVIDDGALRLIRRAETQVPHMPIDSFLSSLAIDRGEYSVGVILSGTGTDGSLGLRAIKEAGGLTFAQDETARYVGMPRSAATTGGADAVLSPEKIAAELVRISTAAPMSSIQASAQPEGSPEDQAFLQTLGLLCDSTGVDFLHYKHSTLLRRIERRMFLRQFTSISDYLAAAALGCFRASIAVRGGSHTRYELFPRQEFIRRVEDDSLPSLDGCSTAQGGVPGLGAWLFHGRGSLFDCHQSFGVPRRTGRILDDQDLRDRHQRFRDRDRPRRRLRRGNRGRGVRPEAQALLRQDRARLRDQQEGARSVRLRPSGT